MTVITKCNQKVFRKYSICYYMTKLLPSATAHPAGNYMFKVNSTNTRTRASIVDFEQVNAGWNSTVATL